MGEWLYRELQRQASRRTARRRDLLYVEGSTDRDRELAAPLQRRAPPCLSGLQAAGTRSVRACPCGVAPAPPPSADPAAKLTFQLDHSRGAVQGQVKRLKDLETENARLRKAISDLT